MNIGELLREDRKITKIRRSEEKSGNETLTDPLLLRWIDNIKRGKNYL